MRKPTRLRTKTLVAALGAALLALGAGAAWRGTHVHAAEQPPPPNAVPVQAVAAKTADVPVYLRGLGTVQALVTVEVRAQVNGNLVAVPVKEGQEVKKGELVAVIDPRPYKAALDQAVAQRAEDQAQLQSAQLDLQRYRSLAKSSFAPVQQVDDQQATVNKLIAAVQADTAAIETAQINLGFTEIRSPVNGRVSLYQTDVGNLIEVANQTNILSITQDKPIDTVFTLPEDDFPRVQQAMAQRALPVEVYSGDGKTKLASGTLAAPNNAIDTTTGTIQLKAVFANDDDRLWPGEFVEAWLLADTLHGAVTLPQQAVQHGPNGLFVFVIQADDTVRQQAVEVGYQDRGVDVVSSGLRGGENVVLQGQSRLSPGTKVTVRPAGGGGDHNEAASGS